MFWHIFFYKGESFDSNFQFLVTRAASFRGFFKNGHEIFSKRAKGHDLETLFLALGLVHKRVAHDIFYQKKMYAMAKLLIPPLYQISKTFAI
jgi:hypothetical protein